MSHKADFGEKRNLNYVYIYIYQMLKRAKFQKEHTNASKKMKLE